jgi:excisionase family DNA binding protein
MPVIRRRPPPETPPEPLPEMRVQPMPIITTPRLLRVKDAAIYLSFSRRSIRELIATRRIPHLRMGRVFFVDRVDLDQFIDQNKIESRA